MESIETNKVYDGIQYVYTYENGYGASVVKHEYSYGGKKELWELAVQKDGELTYDTHITSDVIGHLEWNDVLNILEDIKAL